jgi:hypothetical protein
MAATRRELAGRLKLERSRIALSSSGGGSTAAWMLAGDMPGFFGAVAVINTLENTNPNLPSLLAGTRVRIYTDIAEGFATECSNRMRDRLAAMTPPAQVIYLGEKALGPGGNDPDYCYAQSDFYRALFTDPRAAQPAAAAPRHRRWWIMPAAGAVLAALLLIWRRWRRHS